MITDQMDKGAFENATLPSFCNSWDEIQNICIFSIQNILNHLEAGGYITPTVKSLHGDYLIKVTEAHHHSHLDPYSENINNYYALEQFPLEAIIENLKLISKKSLEIIPTFVFENPIKFDLLECKEAQIIYECMEKAVETYFGANDVKVNFPGISNSQNENSKELSLIFKITSSELDFTNYENLYKNDVAKKLWNSIKEELKKDLPGTEIRISKWDISSINIEISIFKDSGKNWEKEEVKQIDEIMPIFSKRIQDSFTGDLSNCTMTYISRRKKKAKPPYSESWVFQIHAFSDDMSKMLDIFDAKAFAEHLEPLVTKEGVKVSGKRLFIKLVTQ